jgi:hypothetical protein
MPAAWQLSSLLVEITQFNSQFDKKLISHSNQDANPVPGEIQKEERASTFF